MSPVMIFVFLIFGAWLAYLNITSLLEMRRGVHQAKVAREWPSVTGKVISSRIVEGRYRSSETRQMIHTYRPVVEFEYEVGGKTFKSQRIAFGKMLFYQASEANDFMVQHAEGALVAVFYDPQRKSDAVLNPDPALVTKLVVADCGMLGAGLAMIAFGIYGFIMAAGQ
jgi:hypothetical protein